MDSPKLAGVLAVTIASLVLTGPLGAATTMEGSITAGHPGSFLETSAAETFSPCDPGGTGDGVDGQWFDMPDLPVFKATVETEPTLRIIELHLFDNECDEVKRVTGFATPPSCCFLGTSVPSETAYVMVSAQAGSGSFTLTLE